MWRAAVFAFFFILGGGLVAATYELHIVRSDEGFLLVPKHPAGLNDIYADIRKWDTSEWKEHPELAKSLVKNGHEKLIKKSIYNDLFGNWFNNDNASHKERRHAKK